MSEYDKQREMDATVATLKEIVDGIPAGGLLMDILAITKDKLVTAKTLCDLALKQRDEADKLYELSRLDKAPSPF